MKIQKVKSKTAMAATFVLIGIVTVLGGKYLSMGVGFKYLGALFVAIGMIAAVWNIYCSHVALKADANNNNL